MEDVFILVAILPSGDVRLYGDANGKPYESLDVANNAAKRLTEDFFWSVRHCAPAKIRILPRPKATTITPPIEAPAHG